MNTQTLEHSARNQFAGTLARIDEVHASTLNPRKRFDEDALQDLAASIAEHGIIEPLVVRNRPGGGYDLIAGERRLRAARLAGLQVVPVVIRENVDDREALELALVENLCRKDIDPIEEAEGHRKLQELGHRVTAIAEKVNRSQEAVSNSMRLLKLPETVQDLISEGKLSVSHGKALASHVQYPKVVAAMTEAALNGTPSRDLEKLGSFPYYRLESGGAAKQLSYAKFPTKGCGECQHLRKLSGVPICLDPDCFGRKDTLAQEEIRAKIRKQCGVETPVKLTDLKYDAYERLTNAPDGCREDCERRSVALGYNDEVVPICLNPKCFRKLVSAATTAERKSKESRLNTFLDRAHAMLDDPEAPVETLRRSAALACLPILDGAMKSILKAAAERIGVELDIELLTTKSWNDKTLELRKLDHLVTLRGQLLALTADVVFRKAIHAAVTNNWESEMRRLYWFIGLDPENPVLEVEEVDDEPADESDEPDCEIPTVGIDAGGNVIEIASEESSEPVLGEVPEVRYVDDAGAEYCTSTGIGSGGLWFTVKRDPGKTSVHRVKSPALPDRPTRAEAQADLDAYAKKHRLRAKADQEHEPAPAERPVTEEQLLSDIRGTLHSAGHEAPASNNAFVDWLRITGHRLLEGTVSEQSYQDLLQLWESKRVIEALPIKRDELSIGDYVVRVTKWQERGPGQIRNTADHGALVEWPDLPLLWVKWDQLQAEWRRATAEETPAEVKP